MMRLPPVTGPAAIADYWRLWAQVGMMAWEAQMVVAMRLMGMGGYWSVAPSETTRMVSEKAAAFTAAAMQGALAGARGEAPGKVAARMVRPIRAKTRANSRRLSRRGPTLPGPR